MKNKRRLVVTLAIASHPIPVLVMQRSQDYYVCPHCKVEILEKHTYYEEGIDYHNDCGCPIQFPKSNVNLDDILGGFLSNFEPLIKT